MENSSTPSKKEDTKQQHPQQSPGAYCATIKRDALVEVHKETPSTSEEEFKLKIGLAEMLKGGVIMDVVNAEQASIAEEAGAVAVMALERIPADIRRDGGIARMSNITLIEDIMNSVSIPVMAKVRIGHFTEAQILSEMGVDFIDESEVLTPADEEFHIAKHDFKIPFVCGATNLGEAVRRIDEGAAMIRSKGEAGTGNIIEATRHMRCIAREIAALKSANTETIAAKAKEYRCSTELLTQISVEQKLPVPLFSAGGIATPADAAMMMQLGAETVFVGSGIFKSEDPATRARATVKAATHFRDPATLKEVSRNLRGAMDGIDISTLEPEQLLQNRGW